MDRRFEARLGAFGVRGCVVLLTAISIALTLGLVARSATFKPWFAVAGTYRADYSLVSPVSIAIGDVNGDGKPDVATGNIILQWGSASVFVNRGDGSFEHEVHYTTGDYVFSVAMGDLNGNGSPDLATANAGSNTVSVLANRGDGIFEAKHDYVTGQGPLSVAIGDVNGDAKPDLVTANGANTISVLANRGDGNFQTNVDYPTGDSPYSVALGDLTGDGKPDLATANNSSDTVSVLVNRGDGRFQSRVDYASGDGPLSVAIGDLNSDGKPDLVVANALGNSVAVFLNRGDGTFRTKLVYATGSSPQRVAIGDVNADGRPDLATADYYSNELSVFLNEGQGRFRGRLRVATEYPGHPRSVAIADLNGDGKTDLAASGGFGVTILLNSPACTVPGVRGKTIPAAGRAIVRGNCRLGRISRDYSSSVRLGRVISQSPSPGTMGSARSKVYLVVSRGIKH
jgi:hypothetical protein